MLNAILCLILFACVLIVIVQMLSGSKGPLSQTKTTEPKVILTPAQRRREDLKKLKIQYDEVKRYYALAQRKAHGDTERQKLHEAAISYLKVLEAKIDTLQDQVSEDWVLND